MNKEKIDNKKIQKLLDNMKKNKLDLSSDEDLSIAIMNLISIEEHMFFTATKTGKIKYLDILREVREMRKKLLKRIIRDYEGEIWCISKHLLAATMRLNEVGTKALGNGKKKEAYAFFKMAYELYALFWGLNLGVVKSKNLKADLKELGFEKNEFIDTKSVVESKEGKPVLSKLGELVKKAIDCCKE